MKIDFFKKLGDGWKWLKWLEFENGIQEKEVYLFMRENHLMAAQACRQYFQAHLEEIKGMQD